MYRQAIDAAMKAWDHIDGMIRFAVRDQAREYARFEAIDLVLKYAPLLLELREDWTDSMLLQEHRRIEKKSSANVTAALEEARARMWENHRLWDHLERNPGAVMFSLREAIGGEHRCAGGRWSKLGNEWGFSAASEEDGVYRLSLSTRLGQIVRAKCPSCAHVEHCSPKAMFLEKTSCPACDRVRWFCVVRWVNGAV